MDTVVEDRKRKEWETSEEISELEISEEISELEISEEISELEISEEMRESQEPAASDEAEAGLEDEVMSFSDFCISDEIVRALRDMGYVNPTEVQKNTIAPALEKRDLIVLSRTGSGKTAAFGVPAVQLISEGRVKKAMVMAPTRELAVQVENELSRIAVHTGIKSLVVYGKHSFSVEAEKFGRGFDLLVGTPGRILDHIENDTFAAREIDLVVLDEADRMLDMGFIDQVNKIIGFTSSSRTTYLFSATIPEEIVKLSAKYLVNPCTIELESDVKTVDEVEQFFFHVKRNEKRTRLLDILEHYQPESCIVFCNTRFEVDRVTDFLIHKGITAKSIHGANSQTMRLKFLNQFKAGGFRVLVATDVAARGLHIEGLELVINYNLPLEKDSYIHRIGRTGRAGKKGLALSMVQEGELYQLYTLEEHAGVMIEELPLPQRKSSRRGVSDESLYGVAFREIGKYDPEAREEAARPAAAKNGRRGAKKTNEKSSAKAAEGKIHEDKIRGNNKKKGEKKQGEKKSDKQGDQHGEKKSDRQIEKKNDRQIEKMEKKGEQKRDSSEPSGSLTSSDTPNRFKNRNRNRNRKKRSSDNPSFASQPADRVTEEKKTMPNPEKVTKPAPNPEKKQGVFRKILNIFKKGGE